MTFVQLTKEDTAYLLTLIAEMDADTAYTSKQRTYTVPKLQKIAHDPRSARLAFQDVEYLLDLIEDDDLEECEQQRAMTQQALLDIQALQEENFTRKRDIQEQRSARRLRRSSSEARVQALQEHFAQARE